MRTIGAAIGATLLCMGFAFAAEPVHHSASQTASDTRQPLYLLPVMAQHQKQNMREHLAAVNEIVAALGKNDFKSVGEAARKLGTTPEMQQMCAHMGAATPGFSDRALAFHATADTIVPAAQSANAQKVLSTLGATLETCVSCHAAYRQEIVSQARWDQLTSDQK